MPTKLDAYKPIIETRLTKYPALSAVRLFAECQAGGYTGSLTQLKVFVRQVRPRPAAEPIVRFETAPGHQAQVDFAEVKLPWGKRFALVVVLVVVVGFSRLLWVRLVVRQDMRTLIRGLEDAGIDELTIYPYAVEGGSRSDVISAFARDVLGALRRQSH